jgi:tetratricopeptide (TPR) repeat protein
MTEQPTDGHGIPIKPAAFRSPRVDHAHEHIERLAYRAAAEPAAGKHLRGDQVGTRVMWIGLGLLLSAAVFVFLVLPDAVQTPALNTPDGPGTAPGQLRSVQSMPPPSVQAAPQELAPWQTAQILRQKEAAEAVTEQFVRLQMDLEDTQVGLWGGQRFDQAIALAQEGDGQFSQREYLAATQIYEQGLALLQALQADAPDILRQNLARGRQALDSYDAQAAKEAFSLVLAMEPGNLEAQKGLARSRVSDEISQLLKSAAESERQGDLAEAMARLERAGQLDPEDQSVASASARLNGALKQRQFDGLMSQAYAELDAGRIENAVKTFGQAASLRPASSEVKEGLAQAESLRRLESITRLQTGAAQLEAREEWNQAADAYRRALNLDNTLVFARDGLSRASERAELDKRLRAYIQQPERLQSDAVYQAAQQTLGIAKQVEPPTPVLGRQITELEKVLSQSRQPVSVLIQSDNQTVVTLIKVGSLGSFTEKTLALRPGTYVATGKRNGYRDVRRSFVVTASDELVRIQVSCEEKI